MCTQFDENLRVQQSFYEYSETIFSESSRIADVRIHCINKVLESKGTNLGGVGVFLISESLSRRLESGRCLRCSVNVKKSEHFWPIFVAFA